MRRKMRKRNSRVQSYPKMGRKEFIARLEPLMPPGHLEKVETAYVFAKYGHRNQWRDGRRVRYFEHPKAVAVILIDELRITDWTDIVLALLHDTVEDSYILSWRRIELNFGEAVTRGLKLLTKRPKNGYIDRLSRHASVKVLMVKLADRLHNLRTLGSCSRGKQRKQIIETREKYIPLADHLVAKLPPKDRWRGEYLAREIRRICRRFSAKLET
jgi:GTP pyrophosphokinase